MLLSKIQGTQALIHYIERSTTQLVEYKALNLVDVGSSPWWRLHHMMLLSMNHIYKVPAHYCIMTRPLGATRCCSSLHDHIYKVPAHYCIMTRPLGATLVEVFMSIRQLQVPGCCKHDNPALGGYIIWSIQFLLVTEMNNMDFFKVAAFILKQVLSHHFVLLKTWGLQVLYYYRRNIFKFSV